MAVQLIVPRFWFLERGIGIIEARIVVLDRRGQDLRYFEGRNTVYLGRKSIRYKQTLLAGDYLNSCRIWVK